MGGTMKNGGLEQQAFRPLPLGQVRPEGWLLEQLRIQADGLSGHLDEFWPDIADSAWIGGKSDGWERGPYWLDGMVPLAFLLDDARLKAKVHHWADYILAHQQPDGWFGTVRDKRISGRGDQRPGRAHYSYEHDSWPRYILLKALIQYHEVTGDKRVIPAMLRFLRRLDEVLEEGPPRAWARFRWADLVVSVHWLFERTGEPWLLNLADRVAASGFDWRGLFERYPYRWRTIGEEQDLTSHVVNNAMAVKAGGVRYRQTGDPADRDAVAQMIAELDRYHGQATGMFSGDEHLAGRNPSQGTELCAVVEYMYSLETLISILGEPALADRLEMIAYNALPATFSPDMWTHQYVHQVNQAICVVAEDRVYTSNGPDANTFGVEPHFGCCTSDMHQGWPKFTASLWMHSADDGLAAVAYAPCSVRTDVRGVPVRIDVATGYPFDETIRISVHAETPVSFPLHLRIPGWADEAQVQIEGGDPSLAAASGFHRVDRQWEGTTILRLSLPMRPRIERRDHGSVSLYRGPLLFALPVGEEWREIGGQAPHADWEVHPTTPWNVALDVEATDPDASVSLTQAPVSSIPFSPDGAPLMAHVRGAHLPGWTLEHNAAGPVPHSPVTTGEEIEELTLIPFGATNLRIAEFPVLSRGPGTGDDQPVGMSGADESQRTTPGP
ncbi:MAG: GH127 / GH146 [uncultured Thermomicrobiales bacterium]|uniref:GH127 / GH146 n=1 Tax=uncultured Thermomicrobiales bacterium TaxID=1645740 RepID=A0A6J4UW19_9BACT|nr:MAG: GH127 / GH146 [uncultured Thermomicrobiales bacterium]